MRSDKELDVLYSTPAHFVFREPCTSGHLRTLASRSGEKCGLKLRPWDTAAGSLIAREAGGTLTDFSGNEFSIRGEETLGSNGLIHDELLDAIKGAKNLT